ncbi:hypothetical protein EVAR_5845_1 [Eumeta japonica]|uniref:YqaJ viral recombinase domain-containing protein n=1 Tax=Eumeta variegata TaxID=151549 RepID=A0A4C1TBV2_EUMVA|nr:hypothetical protein EVAR_5845_1 [Eumeta japonica]
MHQLVYEFKNKSVEDFLKKVQISPPLIKQVEEETREQSESDLWFQLRYGRITASRAHEVSRCKTNDGTLVSLILGGKIPDTPSMKRGRILEDEDLKPLFCFYTEATVKYMTCNSSAVFECPLPIFTSARPQPPAPRRRIRDPRIAPTRIHIYTTFKYKL